jgi:ribosomal protein L21E
MAKHKSPSQKGKISFTRYFQKLKAGDSVAVDKELSVKFGYSYRVQGRTGKVVKQRGSAYEVLIPDLNDKKTYFIKPIHLKKVEDVK